MIYEYLDDVIIDLPDEAYVDKSNSKIDDNCLALVNKDEQISAILQCFFQRYCDPAEATPYISSESEYIWVHGGPYDASEEIEERFYNIVDDAIIEKTIEMLNGSGIFYWAPTHFESFHDDFYFDPVVKSFDEAIEHLKKRRLVAC